MKDNTLVFILKVSRIGASIAGIVFVYNILWRLFDNEFSDRMAKTFLFFGQILLFFFAVLPTNLIYKKTFHALSNRSYPFASWDRKFLLLSNFIVALGTISLLLLFLSDVI